jgi:hypothetical protein
MITETQRMMLLLFVDHLGVPLREVLRHDRGHHYERVTERLVAAHGDALDILTVDTPDADRRNIIKAAALVRCVLATTTQED